MTGESGRTIALLVILAFIPYVHGWGFNLRSKGLALGSTASQLPPPSRGPTNEEAAADFSWPVTQEIPLPKIQQTKSRCQKVKEFKPYVILVAGLRHDPRWIASLGDDVEAIVYQQEDKQAPNYYSEHGNEAGAYIQFMIDYYDCLPNVTAFVHGHEAEGWHSFNMRDTMFALQWDKIPGYTDLNRKPGIWDMDMRDRPKYPSHHPIATGEDVYTGDYVPQARYGGNAWAPNEIFEWTQQEINVHAYDRFFGPLGLGAMPHKISFPCCSQFAVTKERIQSRSRFFWQQNMHFMQYNDVQASNLRPKSHMVGDIWTIYWPMLLASQLTTRGSCQMRSFSGLEWQVNIAFICDACK